LYLAGKPKSAEWIARQLTEGCGWSEPPHYLIRDRDGAYGEAFIRRLTATIGLIRQNCLNHVVIFDEQYLRHLLNCLPNNITTRAVGTYRRGGMRRFRATPRGYGACSLFMVFSLDSMAGIGLVGQVEIMIAALIFAMIVIYVASGPVAAFIAEHPTTEMSVFLLLIGMALITEGFDFHIPRGYTYFAMIFAGSVEGFNVLALQPAALRHVEGAIAIHPYQGSRAYKLLGCWTQTLMRRVAARLPTGRAGESFHNDASAGAVSNLRAGEMLS
jgi:hypothetical protein